VIFRGLPEPSGKMLAALARTRFPEGHCLLCGSEAGGVVAGDGSGDRKDVCRESGVDGVPFSSSSVSSPWHSAIGNCKLPRGLPAGGKFVLPRGLPTPSDKILVVTFTGPGNDACVRKGDGRRFTGKLVRVPKDARDARGPNDADAKLVRSD
jgi:hypothetical protein